MTASIEVRNKDWQQIETSGDLSYIHPWPLDQAIHNTKYCLWNSELKSVWSLTASWLIIVAHL